MFSVYQVRKGYKVLSMGVLRNDDELKQYERELVDAYGPSTTKEAALMLNDGSIQDGHDIRFSSKEFHFFVTTAQHKSNTVPVYDKAA